MLIQDSQIVALLSTGKNGDLMEFGVVDYILNFADFIMLFYQSI